MFVQNSNKITLSVSTNPNIMENIKKLKIIIMYALIKNLYLFMLNDRTLSTLWHFLLPAKYKLQIYK
jgi:hypothetical protein